MPVSNAETYPPKGGHFVQEIVSLIQGLGDDFYLLGVLVFSSIAGIRLVIGHVAKLCKVEDAMELAWRDVIWATIGMVVTGVVITIVNKILSSQAIHVWKVLK